MTSFVTCIKLCPGYEDYVHRLKVYVENISALCPKPFEIIIVEEKTDRFAVKETLTLKWLMENGARVVEYTPTYDNPHGYNMIEAFAKNVGILEAKHHYLCVTNSDVFFDAAFFEHLKMLKPSTFYRFKQYEVAIPEEWTWESALKGVVEAKWENPQVQNGTVQGIAHKSGDVMLMHRDEWLKIGGFPENQVWVHSDLIVCVVVSNNGIAVEIPEARVYTFAQVRERVEQPHEMQTALKYSTRLTTNPYLDHLAAPPFV